MTSTLQARGAVKRGPFGIYLTGPPPVTPTEKTRREWPERETAPRTEAVAPPFEGHSCALGE